MGFAKGSTYVLKGLSCVARQREPGWRAEDNENDNYLYAIDT
jgi:hypothetical protein